MATRLRIGGFSESHSQLFLVDPAKDARDLHRCLHCAGVRFICLPDMFDMTLDAPREVAIGDGHTRFEFDEDGRYYVEAVACTWVKVLDVPEVPRVTLVDEATGRPLRF